MRLYRLDSSQSSFHAGILCIFPSGASKQIAYTIPQAGIPDTLATAKKCVAALVDHMMQAGLIDDLERTNLVSAVAAMGRLIRESEVRALGSGVGVAQ